MEGRKGAITSNEGTITYTNIKEPKICYFSCVIALRLLTQAIPVNVNKIYIFLYSLLKQLYQTKKHFHSAYPCCINQNQFLLGSQVTYFYNVQNCDKYHRIRIKNVIWYCDTVHIVCILTMGFPEVEVAKKQNPYASLQIFHRFFTFRSILWFSFPKSSISLWQSKTFDKSLRLFVCCQDF